VATLPPLIPSLLNTSVQNALLMKTMSTMLNLLRMGINALATMLMATFGPSFMRYILMKSKTLLV
jgi:hypothetical protein